MAVTPEVVVTGSENFVFPTAGTVFLECLLAASMRWHGYRSWIIMVPLLFIGLAILPLLELAGSVQGSVKDDDAVSWRGNRSSDGGRVRSRLEGEAADMRPGCADGRDRLRRRMLDDED